MVAAPVLIRPYSRIVRLRCSALIHTNKDCLPQTDGIQVGTFHVLKQCAHILMSWFDQKVLITIGEAWKGDLSCVRWECTLGSE